MVDKNLTFKISADDGDAVKAFRNVAGAAKSELGAASKELDDTRTAGQKMADALSSVAEQLEADLARLDSASAKLGAALGPELAAKAERGVEGIVQDLRRAGLTFEEIEADAEDLAAAIKRLDDIEVGSRAQRGFDNLDNSVRRVGDTTDKTRSVMANFAGNAASELPGVANALGPVNVAVGQFAEYAAEGDIAMRNLVKAIAPMAAATVGLAAANHLMGQWKAATEAAGEAVDALAERVREGQRGIEAMREEWQETGAVQAAVGKLFGSGAKDVTEALVKVGLNAEQAAQLIEGGRSAIDDWRLEVQGMGVDFDDAWRAALILWQQLNFVEQAERNAAIQAGFFRDVMEYTSEEIAAVAAEAQALAGGVNAVGGAVGPGSTNYQAVQDWTNLLLGIPKSIYTTIDTSKPGAVLESGRRVRAAEQQNVGLEVGLSGIGQNTKAVQQQWRKVADEVRAAKKEVEELNAELAKVPTIKNVRIAVDIAGGRQISEALNKYQRIGGNGGPR